MGQDFTIINRQKKQYLDPFSMPSSTSFPSIILNPLMCQLVTWLVCTSTNDRYARVKVRGYYTRKHLGAWNGDSIEVIGDYDEEDLSHHVHNRRPGHEYEDIAPEAIAMLIENDPDMIEEWVTDARQSGLGFKFLASIGKLEYSPETLTDQLAANFGEDWRSIVVDLSSAGSYERWRDRYSKVIE
jgi:hypothetical protein